MQDDLIPKTEYGDSILEDQLVEERSVSEILEQKPDSDDNDIESDHEPPTGLKDPTPDICGDPTCEGHNCKDLLHVDIYLYRDALVCILFHWP